MNRSRETREDALAKKKYNAVAKTTKLSLNTRIGLFFHISHYLPLSLTVERCSNLSTYYKFLNLNYPDDLVLFSPFHPWQTDWYSWQSWWRNFTTWPHHHKQTLNWSAHVNNDEPDHQKRQLDNGDGLTELRVPSRTWRGQDRFIALCLSLYYVTNISVVVWAHAAV